VEWPWDFRFLIFTLGVGFVGGWMVVIGVILNGNEAWKKEIKEQTK